MKLGRGLNIPAIWFDEFAFLSLNQTVYMSARPALTRASEIAESMHMPRGILITTTPKIKLLGDILVIICKNFLNCWKLLLIKDNQQPLNLIMVQRLSKPHK